MSLDRARWEATLDKLAAQAARDADRNNDTELANVARMLADAAGYLWELQMEVPA